MVDAVCPEKYARWIDRRGVVIKGKSSGNELKMETIRLNKKMRKVGGKFEADKDIFTTMMNTLQSKKCPDIEMHLLDVLPKESVEEKRLVTDKISKFSQLSTTLVSSISEVESYSGTLYTSPGK